MAHSFLKKMLDAESNRFRIQIISCLGGAVLLFNSYVANWMSAQEELVQLLAVMAALMLGLPLVLQALADLWHENAEMNELAALSFVASFSVGEYRTAAAIAFFMLLAQLIEYRSQLGARRNIESLLRLTPTKAVKVTADNTEITVDCAQLVKGDIVRVRPGDNIPADAVVLHGCSSVNEASITGESLPVEKRRNDDVFGGSINISGVMDLQIAKAGSDTTLAKIKKLILQAEESRTPVMRLIDKYAGYYTPVILVLAAVVLFFTRDINRAVSMLIIACPCTVLLSAPSAMVAALSAAARLGVIIKDVSVLEVASKVNALIFDKTGTLTTGSLKVSQLFPAEGVDANELLTLAASVEFNSRHPVAKAIVAEAQRRDLVLRDICGFSERSGFGTKAMLDGTEVLVGNAQWMEKHDISGVVSARHDELSILHVVSGGRFLGSISLSDSTREDAVNMMNALRKNDISRLVMLTGDRWSAAKKVADELKCEVDAEVLPEQKMQKVLSIKSEGRTVAVVGDGVNDAPALASGDVSVAMGAAGSDVAVHSASIVLMNEKLDRIPFIIHLSRRTIAVMTQNLVFSILYIFTLLVLSAGGIIHPVLAVVMHTASALLVVFNSARLLREGEELS